MEKIGLLVSIARSTLLAIGISHSAFADLPFLISLGNPPGGFEAEPSGVSSIGPTVVGLYRVGSNGAESFVWTPEDGIIRFADLPGGTSDYWLRGVSDDGAVLFGGSVAAPFRWTADEGLVRLAEQGGSVEAASSDGSVLVGDVLGHAFRWSDGSGLIPLPDPTGYPQLTHAWDVSADGSVVVGSATFSYQRYMAIRWTISDGVSTLDIPQSWATAVSADGSTVVGSTVAGGSFRWTVPGGVEWLDGYAESSVIRDMSADGSKVVVEIGRRPYIWLEHSNLWHLGTYVYFLTGLGSEWYLFTVAAISADGRAIVGTALTPDYWNLEAYLVYLGSGCEIPGDINRDGPVDMSDLSILLGNFGRGQSFPFHGDVDWNGRVDLQDLGLLLASFGTTCSD